MWRYSITLFANNWEASGKAFATTTADKQHGIPGRWSGDHGSPEGGDLDKIVKKAVVKSMAKLRSGPRSCQVIPPANPTLTWLIEQNCMVINVRSQENEARKRKGMLWEERVHVNLHTDILQNTQGSFTMTPSFTSSLTSRIRKSNSDLLGSTYPGLRTSWHCPAGYWPKPQLWPLRTGVRDHHTLNKKMEPASFPQQKGSLNSQSFSPLWGSFPVPGTVLKKRCEPESLFLIFLIPSHTLQPQLNISAWLSAASVRKLAVTNLWTLRPASLPPGALRGCAVDVLSIGERLGEEYS